MIRCRKVNAAVVNLSRTGRQSFVLSMYYCIKRPTMRRMLRWSPTESTTSAKDLNLFGPPPMQNDFDLSTAETIMHSDTIKQRTNRRSDQRRNRVFSDNFNVVELVHLDTPRMHNASGSGSSSAKSGIGIVVLVVVAWLIQAHPHRCT